MESIDFPRGETVGPTMPKSHSTFLMSSFVSHKSQSGSKGEVKKESTSGGSQYNKYRRSVYKPSTKYHKLYTNDDEERKYEPTSQKRGKSTTISHSSAYYTKKPKK